MHGLLSKAVAFPILYFIQSTVVFFVRNKHDIIFPPSSLLPSKECYSRIDFGLLHWN